MKPQPWLPACLSLLTLSASAAKDGPIPVEKWTPLLDEKLSRFETFIDVPHPTVVIPGYIQEADPKQDMPLGMNNDPLHVFSVRTEADETILHITGEIFGVLSTREVYGDFHLRVQFRWGTAKHEPRLTKPRDNGILYRCFGPVKVWSQSMECQVQERDIGDYYALGSRAMATSRTVPAPNGKTVFGIYNPGEPLRMIQNRCSHGPDYQELPNGAWNTVEILSVGDRSIHILNGHVVNILQDAVHTVEGVTKPLVSGKVMIQSEGAECDYRRVEISGLKRFPDEYQKLFRPSPETPRG